MSRDFSLQFFTKSGNRAGGWRETKGQTEAGMGGESRRAGHAERGQKGPKAAEKGRDRLAGRDAERARAEGGKRSPAPGQIPALFFVVYYTTIFVRLQVRHGLHLAAKSAILE